jgi:hypothetical protein
MISMLGAALVGDLLLLPAILLSPAGHFFGGTAKPAPSMTNTNAEQTIPESALVDEADHSAVAELPAPELDEVPATANGRNDFSRELLEGPHAALHAKLRSLRREGAPHDPVS